MKSKKFAAYVKKNLVQMKIIKMNLSHTVKSEIIVFTQENAHTIWNLRYKTPKEILVVFLYYDYHFITNKLAKEFYVQLECLGENTEKHIAFSVKNIT